MLETIDEGLEAFLRATVPLSATDVDVSFEAPNREWSAKLNRPTVNLFLWDIRRSTNSRSGMRTVSIDGLTVHEPAMPIVELRYVVSAWTSDHSDERALLAGVLRSMLIHGAVPREFLPDEYARLEVPTLSVARAGEDHIDVFKALEGQLKPGLNVVLTTEFDTGFSVAAGPPVGGLETALGAMNGSVNGHAERRRRVAGEVARAADRGAIGAIVRAPGGATRVNIRGQFLVRANAGDEVVLELDPPVTATVPDSGGIRFE